MQADGGVQRPRDAARATATPRARLLPDVLKTLHEEGVEIRGCPVTCEVFGEAVPAEEADWTAEYLDKILAVRVVDGLDAAIDHIQRFGSDHTEIIVTGDYANAQAWLRRLNSSTVGVNCSTAFSDGYRLASGRRSASPPRACTRTGPWAWRASPRASSSSTETASSANDGAPRRASGDRMSGLARQRPETR